MPSNAPHQASEPETPSFEPPTRPTFDSRHTLDRIREGSSRLPSFPMVHRLRKDRKSIFRETGLLDDGPTDTTYSPEASGKEHDLGDLAALAAQSRKNAIDREENEDCTTRSSTQDDDDDDSGRGSVRHEDEATLPSPPTGKQSWYARMTTRRRPQIKAASSAPPSVMSSLSRFTMIALLIAVVLPGFGYNSGRGMVDLSGAAAGVVRGKTHQTSPILDVRADSPTDVCTRWSHQAAHLNGTLYIYGGQAKSEVGQKDNTWNNNLLTLDLTKSWDTKSPALKGLPQPSGPPAVSNGYLWNDYNNLFLYGGEFADNPYQEPAEIATWRYTIASQTWTKFADQKTALGNFSDGGGALVQRSAEGAGLSVPELGISWYFGGHLDLATTPGWSYLTKRVYLKSLLEFTHPGYTNNGVQSLASGTGAGEGGVYRNITQGGLQTDKAFSERADGALVFVPGWGTAGVLIGLGGGNEDTFSNDFGTLDVYDIANSVWYHQQTKGDAPSVRVNPCAVIASAPDASSFNIYVYGGQNLQPYKEQIQYNDMWILTIPSFSWVRVPDQENPPAARAGHSCNMRDGQMIVVGGFVGKDAPCDNPGIYVFNTTSLQWQSSFNALSHTPDVNWDNSVLAGSFGYKVPEPVVSVIGGSPDGGATATTPAAGPANGGPFATGHPPVYTVTATGSAATVTSWNGDSLGPGSPPSPSLVTAGVIAGLAGLLAGYLGFCAWLYRRQVRAYKTHLAVANRYSGGAAASKTSFGGLAALFSRKESRGSRPRPHRPVPGEKLAASEHPYDSTYGYLGHGRGGSSSTTESFAWVGREEPKGAWLSDEPTPGSGSGGTTSSGAARPPAGGTPYGGSSDERPPGWYGQHGQQGQQAHGVMGGAAGGRRHRRGSDSGSTSSTEGLLDGQEPSFFSVVLGPRRALRVVNGLEEAERD